MKMKKSIFWLGILALALVFGMTVVGCDNDPADNNSGEPQTATHTGTSGGTTYTLVITDGTAYVLTLTGTGATKTSRGTVTVNGSTFTLKPSNAAATFTVTVNTNGITGMSGTITFTDGNSQGAPEEITPTPPTPPNPGTGGGSGKITITLVNSYSRNITGIRVLNSANKNVLYNSGTINLGGYKTFLVDVTGVSQIDITVDTHRADESGFTTSGSKTNINVVPGKYYSINFHLEYGTGQNNWFVFNVTESTPSHGSGDITYTATPNSTTNTLAINLAFSVPVFLTANNITVTNGTGSVAMGTLTGDQKQWSLGVTVNTAGNVTVKIIKSGIESGDKTVAVAKGSGGGDENILTSIAELRTWILAQPANNTTPYNVKLNVSSYGTGNDSLGYVLRNSSDKKVNLDLSGSTFTSIGNNVFENCTGLTGVTLPDTVTSIGDNAFLGCTGLTSIIIPDRVTTIGGIYSSASVSNRFNYGAFKDCTNLTSVTIGNNVTIIGDSAFRSCSKLTRITIPDSVTGIGYAAFSGCGLTGALIIPDSVTTLEVDAFNGCSITSINIPANLTSINFGAFDGCNKLTTITVDENNANYASHDGIVYNKEKTAIQKVPRGISGNAVTFPASLTTISGFSYCAGLTGITIPDSVTIIGFNAFENCTGFTSVTIPDSVTSIGGSAFSGCTGLTSVTIGDSVTTINVRAFYGCTRLTSITIPASVTEIGRNAFNNCTRLTSVTFEGMLPSTSEAWTTEPSNYQPFLGDLRTKYYTGGIGTYTTTASPVLSNSVWTKSISAITAPVWRDGNSVSLTAPVTGGTVTAQGWQISDTGSSGWSDFTPPATADMSYNGKYLRYYVTISSSTHYSNTVTIRVISATMPWEVTIAMWDSGNDGWDYSAALRINVNGTNLASNASVSTTAANNTPSGQRSTNTYIFTVNSGDTVQIYWVSGGSADQECAFAVYYSDDPPSPMFVPSSGTTGGKVLVSKRYQNPSGAVGNGTLMGSFTAP